ncbi:hypothetical protein HNP99_000072 [Flavobacterium sp. 28A]|uniref:hypothetical protein n=1 Tax=Flavobacterium sp. 28A TaxID=2735895 RepID=UPI00156E9BD2|nr:hypothetical protein [Flavobacterium sp. 28A]NRT13747.1 hypothetical protein [Flavobacterium sp. 28A]
MIKKKNVIPLLFLLAFFIFLLYGQIRSLRYDNDLKERGVVTIGKIDSIQKFPKRSYLWISYYIRNKKYSSSENNSYIEITNKNIGRFYYVKYLPNSTNIVRGVYSEEVTDTVAILNAGFSREEIVNLN